MSKKEEILNETYLLFSEYGYALSLSQVTSKLGLKKQSIYNYFDSKDALISEMLEARIEFYYEALTALLYTTKEMTAGQRLNEIMFFVVDYFKSPVKLKLRRWLMLLNEESSMASVLKKTSHHEALFFDQLRLIIQDGIDSGEILIQDKEEVLITYMIMLRGMIEGLSGFSVNNHRDLTNTMINKFWKMMI